MVIPEIAKFEQKILTCNENIARYEEIIRGFDEVIQTKSSKISHDSLKKHVLEDCTKKDQLIDFFNQAEKNKKVNEDAIILQKNMIEELNTSLKSKIQREVFKQTADVRKSVFQEDKDYEPAGAGANTE